MKLPGDPIVTRRLLIAAINGHATAGEYVQAVKVVVELRLRRRVAKEQA